MIRFLLRQLRGKSSSGDRTRYQSYNSHGRPFGSRVNTKSSYDILGVSPKSSRNKITKRYRELVRQYHPDKVAHMAVEFREIAEKRIKEINRAYDELTR